ncbi:hypothetical protein L227DRAFT_560993 [Lentinus tigrinus ALCF2SS1-6]|uniref:Uncharacterized protein n=1 Tax=Lentinus tigrinus ALCF2SS1-6 TaxID=1328759 RepID=A0A5C2SLX8_9APHY|nr:hypothetical protein L227DRAFT_560993 [Lentinus tigrinus ALCF2SS1-6]
MTTMWYTQSGSNLNVNLKRTDLNRQERLYTFRTADDSIYTVVNLPDRIKLPTGSPVNPEETLSLKELKEPQHALVVPEMPYILHMIPLHAPLLGRLCVEPELTQTSSVHEQLGTSRQHSPLLGEVGERYANVHHYYDKAAGAIRRARVAMVVLAARLSMVIAVWSPPPPDMSPVPKWVNFLREQSIPECWITALHHQLSRNESIPHLHTAYNDDVDEPEPAFEDDELQTCVGGGPVYAEEEEESDDELLLTTETAKTFNREATVQHKSVLHVGSNDKYHTFMSNHPQAYIHEVRLIDESEGFVPNFIGGPLPVVVRHTA